jgi:DNA-binding NarL/FixJ family response regulator
VAKIRVLIADDHAILREGLRALLRPADDIEVVGEAADGGEAVEKAMALKPEIILMDVNMPGLGGLEATLELKKRGSDAKVVVLTQYEEPEYVRRFLKAGVSGYLLKKAAGSELAAAIRAASRGGLVLDPSIAREAFGGGTSVPSASRADAAGAGGGDPYESLTDREKQVLKLVAEGRSNKEVAEELGISVKTAMTHREHLMEKLGAHSRTDLVRFAIKRGVIQV